MKRLTLMVAAAALLLASSCTKDELMSPEDQKLKLETVSRELDHVLDGVDMTEVSRMSAYYDQVLSGYDSKEVRNKVGNVMGLTSGFFSAVPSTKGTANWSVTSKSGVFRANATARKWEYVGVSTDGKIHFEFKDDQGRDCQIVIQFTLLTHAEVGVYVGSRLIASCVSDYSAKSLFDMEASLTVSYGSVVSSTTASSSNGSYFASEKVTVDGIDVANCQVKAADVSWIEGGAFNSFKNLSAEVNVLDQVFVVVNCKASLSDLMLGVDYTKDYCKQIEANLGKYVDAKVYYDGGDNAQAEIRFRVERNRLAGPLGCILPYPVCIVPYIYFNVDGSTCELSSVINSRYVIDEILSCIEELLGGMVIDY